MLHLHQSINALFSCFVWAIILLSRGLSTQSNMQVFVVHSSTKKRHYLHGFISMNDLFLNIVFIKARSNSLCNTALIFFRTSKHALCPKKGSFPFICAIRLNMCSNFGRGRMKKSAIYEEITRYFLSIELQQRAAQMAQSENSLAVASGASRPDGEWCRYGLSHQKK